MVVAAWHMLSTGEPYNDPGGDYFQKRFDPQRQAQRHIAALAAMGYTVTLTPAA